MAYAKTQQNQENNNTLGGGGLTGSANAVNGQGNATQGGTSAGTPGGFTNIQDYMGANKGDTTNQNYLNTKADTQIENQANALNTAISGVSAINQNPTANNSELQNILNTNAYDKARTYATNPTFTNTAQELPDVYSGDYNPTKKLTGDLSSVMSYIGEVKPQSQQYTPGMQKFDEMLLSGDKEFPQQFAKNKQAEYKQKVEDPYGAATVAREAQKTQATQNAKNWQNTMKDYLGGEDKKISDILTKQQQQEKENSDLTEDEFKQMYANKLGFPDWKTYSDKISTLGATGKGISIPTNENYKDTVEYTGATTPNIGTAATEYSTENISDYNALADILGQNQLIPTNTYTPGKWIFKNWNGGI